MAAATKMTPAEFLASDPFDHPDFVPCNDPRADGRHRGQTLFLPNLVALIRRLGGPDAIPDRMHEPLPAGDGLRAIDWEVLWANDHKYGVMLKDRTSHLVYAELSRLGVNCLEVEGWHQRELGLSLTFEIPADWSGGAWETPVASIQDTFSATAELDALAAATLDYWLGSIDKATHTYCHIRRDVFID
jgi:hypothetical protein